MIFCVSGSWNVPLVSNSSTRPAWSCPRACCCMAIFDICIKMKSPELSGTFSSKAQLNRLIPQPLPGFSRQPCWRAETMKQFCMKIDLISLQHGGNDVTWKCSIPEKSFLIQTNEWPEQWLWRFLYLVVHTCFALSICSWAMVAPSRSWCSSNVFALSANISCRTWKNKK